MNTLSLMALAGLYFAHFFRHGMVLPLIPLYAAEMGASSAMVGLIISGFNLLPFCLALYVGRLADKIEVRVLLFIATAANVIYGLLLFAASSPWGLFGAQICGGLGGLFFIVSSQAAVSRVSDSRYRERSFGLLSFTAALGQASGPMVGGWLESFTGYRTVFWVAALIALSGLLAWVLRTEDQASHRPAPRWSEARTMLADPCLLGVLLFTLGIIFAVSLRGSFLPLLLSHKGLSTQAIGSYLSLFALAMILVRLGVGRLMGKVSRSVLVAVALVLVTLGVGSVPFLHDHWALAGALGMFGLGFGISQPLSMVMVSDLASKENSGLVIGIRFMTLTLGTFLSPIILGFVAEVAGLKAPFVVSGLFLLLIIAVLGWARAVAKRRQ